jgi:hypothetical protein
VGGPAPPLAAEILCLLKRYRCNFLIIFMPFQIYTKKIQKNALAFLS